MASRKRPTMPIMRACDHCDGEGEVQVCCDDCGDALDESNAADHEDDLCIPCAEARAADEAVPRRSGGT